MTGCWCVEWRVPIQKKDLVYWLEHREYFGLEGPAREFYWKLSEAVTALRANDIPLKIYQIEFRV